MQHSRRINWYDCNLRWFQPKWIIENNKFYKRQHWTKNWLNVRTTFESQKQRLRANGSCGNMTACHMERIQKMNLKTHYFVQRNLGACVCLKWREWERGSESHKSVTNMITDHSVSSSVTRESACTHKWQFFFLQISSHRSVVLLCICACDMSGFCSFISSHVSVLCHIALTASKKNSFPIDGNKCVRKYIKAYWALKHSTSEHVWGIESRMQQQPCFYLPVWDNVECMMLSAILWNIGVYKH